MNVTQAAGHEERWREEITKKKKKKVGGPMPGTALSTSQFCLNGVFHIPLNLEYVSPVGRMSEFKPCCKNPMKVLPD